MASNLDVVNRALSRLGAARISLVTDDTKNARAARSALELVRAEVLADHPWNCATKRARLYASDFTITAAAWQAGPLRYRVTCGTHTLKVDDPVSIDGVDGSLAANLNDNFVVGARTATTIDLKDPDTGLFVDGSSFPAYTSGGVVHLRGLWQHDFQYDLPSDLLRLLEIEDQRESDWLVESGRLITDLRAPLDVRYIWLNEDTDSYPPLLVSAFAARLASELALEIVDSPSKSQLALEAYHRLLRRAKRIDGQEQTPTVLEESRWVTARLEGGTTFGGHGGRF